jgi:hypothetical protein
VLSDFNVNLDTDLVHEDIPVVVSSHTRLSKGYHRVIVIDPVREVPFEVILHNKEAYGREVEGIEEFMRSLQKTDSATGTGDAGYPVVLDYSTGWKHSLAIVSSSSSIISSKPS